jgi:hypothetical protein
MCDCLKNRSETSRGIEKKLKEDKKAAQYHIKLLLLGKHLFFKNQFKSLGQRSVFFSCTLSQLPTMR